MKLLTVALLSLSFAACGSGDAIDFELDVDPNISTTTELAERLGTIVVVLDSDEGLYPPGSEATEGDLQIKNTDSDPALELVHTIPIADAKLPTFRLDRGGLSVNAVDIRVIGLERDTSTPIAEGAARAISFGSKETVSVPFNFLDQERPARVTAVYPGDGMSIQGCSVSSVSVVFSRPMDSATVENAITIHSPQVSTPTVTLNASELVGDITFAEPIMGEGEQIVIDLEIASDALAADGSQLDQIGGEAGAQPYRATLHIACEPPPSLPCNQDCPWACGAKECPSLPQIACVEGVCVPIACSEPCADETVCDPLHDACVPDCRGADSLSTCTVGTCSETTGLCE